MKESYIDCYVDSRGNIIERPIFKKFMTILFAGFKFLFDRIMATIGLLIAAPFMLIIAIAIKLDSKGPVFFRQVRTGKHGKNFTIFKFRTMVEDNDVHDFSIQDRHTKVGKFLRKTSLDEIPQLISIVSGKMSFIGPRPWITDYYDNMNDIQRRRYAVRPGLTGLAQAKGRNGITIEEKIKYDLEYIENYSLQQDIKIIFLTIKAVLTGEGADAGKDVIKNELKDLKKKNK